MSPPSKAPPYPKTRGAWLILLLTALMTAAATVVWYRLRLHRTHTEWMPALAVGLTVWFFFLLRVIGGVRLARISREGRVVVASSLVLVALLWWFGRMGFFARNIASHLPDSVFEPLYGFFYFSSSCFLLRTAIPLVIILAWFRRRPADYGYRLRGGTKFVWIYALLATAVILAIWFYASKQPVFVAKYPMCRRMIVDGAVPLWQFAVYQLAYGLIFVSGESFWRGYIAFGLERDLGYLALVFMIIPYTTIHFGKPLVETLGAIVTGLVLGYLALKHRSFWLGVATHWSVALAMDLSAMARGGVGFVW